MRLIGKLQTYHSWFGFVLFWAGAVMLYILAFRIMPFNVSTSAAAMAMGLGAQVTEIPSLVVANGSFITIMPFFGTATWIGWFIFLVQVVFWTTDDLGVLNKGAKQLMGAVLVYDFVTCFFFLMGGAGMFNLDPVAFVVRAFWSVVLAGGVLSLATPFWMALCLEIFRSQYKEGLGGLWNIVKTIGSAVGGASNGLTGALKGNDNPDQPHGSQRGRREREPEVSFGGGAEDPDLDFDAPLTVAARHGYGGNGGGGKNNRDRGGRNGGGRPDNGGNFR